MEADLEATVGGDWSLLVTITNSEALRALAGETIGTRILGCQKVELSTSHKFKEWNPKDDNRTFEQYLTEYADSAKQKQVATVYANDDVIIEVPQAALMFNYKKYWMDYNLNNLKINASEDFITLFKKNFPKAEVIVEIDYSK